MSRQINSPEAEIGIFFNIQRFSVHDGPGIRTVFFAKGCPLHCLWCSNPESQKFEPEVAYKYSSCIGVKQCGLCMDACLQGAVTPHKDGGVVIDRMLCTNCGRCAEVCPAKALVFLGKEYSVEELTEKVEEDGNYYWRSGGGPTFSGGEPLAQPLFVSRLLATLRAKGYHTVIETCGHFDLNTPGVHQALRNTDSLLYDIKIMNPVKHKVYTGQSNERILSNILELSRSYPKIEIVARTPVIPGVNDTEEDIKEIAMFLREVPTLRDYELLAYHAFGTPKYAQLGKPYALLDLKPVGTKKMKKLQDLTRNTLALGEVERIV